MTRKIIHPTHDSSWMIGPPTEPGLYGYQLQGSGVIRYYNVFKWQGKLCITAGDGSGCIPVEQPYCRWAVIGREMPHADPSWRDPRYLKERES